MTKYNLAEYRFVILSFFQGLLFGLFLILTDKHDIQLMMFFVWFVLSALTTAFNSYYVENQKSSYVDGVFINSIALAFGIVLSAVYYRLIMYHIHDSSDIIRGAILIAFVNLFITIPAIISGVKLGKIIRETPRNIIRNFLMSAIIGITGFNLWLFCWGYLLEYDNIVGAFKFWQSLRNFGLISFPILTPILFITIVAVAVIRLAAKVETKKQKNWSGILMSAFVYESELAIVYFYLFISGGVRGDGSLMFVMLMPIIGLGLVVPILLNTALALWVSKLVFHRVKKS